MFEDLMSRIKVTISSGVFRSSTSLESMQNFMAQIRRPRRMQTSHAEVSLLSKPVAAEPKQATQKDNDTFSKALERAEAATKASAKPAEDNLPAQPVVRDAQKVGRNDPCPCGSGKKYKKCCGANEL